MTKLVVIMGAVLLLAGVATASTLTGFVPQRETQTVSIPADTALQNTVRQDTVEDTVRQETVRRADHRRGRRARGVREPGEDVRGPCDEAEHVNDPRCTGAAPARTVEDDDRGEDRSGRGSNSGPGSGSSGRDDEDHSGRGSGGGDDSESGNSGRGGGDDD